MKWKKEANDFWQLWNDTEVVATIMYSGLNNNYKDDLGHTELTLELAKEHRENQLKQNGNNE
jgi:hypothetical protein